MRRLVILMIVFSFDLRAFGVLSFCDSSKSLSFLSGMKFEVWDLVAMQQRAFAPLEFRFPSADFSSIASARVLLSDKLLKALGSQWRPPPNATSSDLKDILPDGSAVEGSTVVLMDMISVGQERVLRLIGGEVVASQMKAPNRYEHSITVSVKEQTFEVFLDNIIRIRSFSGSDTKFL